MMKPSFSIFVLFTLALSCAYAATPTPVPDFGDNPGNIKMYKYVPANMPTHAPLVISLHGCRQNAAIYSRAGWTELADEWKFYLVFPEQSLVNNAYRCWNWFAAGDSRRGQGEIASIIEMINKMKADYSIDGDRIYVEGLSAGGWMTANLLTAYPDLFAGGATNAGGPAFCAMTEKYFWDFWGWWYATSAQRNAERCMQGTDKSPAAWGDLARQKGHDQFDGRWPVISIWQGSADNTVNALNQQEIVDQWTDLHAIDTTPDHREMAGPGADIVHDEYHDDAGTVLVETWLIPGMAHGTPIAVDAGQACGEESDYILDAGICAVRRIGRYWGLDE